MSLGHFYRRYLPEKPHRSQRDLAIHNYHCIDWGPVLAKVISLKQAKPSEPAAV